jgi:TRAP transporter TAXI family solute receptor
MQQRLAVLLILAGLLATGVALSGGGLAQSSVPNRIAFQIGTGSTEGTYFPVGQAIAGLISHPLGVARCETATVCGPTGVILSARTSDGSIGNLRDVNDGQVDSAIAQGDTIAQAVAGQGIFRGAVPRHVRVIAALFNEQVHLVAADPDIRSVADLRGKRVLLGTEGSGTGVVARQVLAAFHVPEHSLKVVRGNSGSEIDLLHSGKIDAYFAVAGMPLEQVRELLARHAAHLVPIDGAGRARLIKAEPQLSPAEIASVYPGTPPVATVATRAFWITRDNEPDARIYGITRALFNPANRAALTASHLSARDIALDSAAQNLPAPLHQGAARYYREMGMLSPAMH